MCNCTVWFAYVSGHCTIPSGTCELVVRCLQQSGLVLPTPARRYLPCGHWSVSAMLEPSKGADSLWSCSAMLCSVVVCVHAVLTMTKISQPSKCCCVNPLLHHNRQPQADHLSHIRSQSSQRIANCAHSCPACHTTAALSTVRRL